MNIKKKLFFTSSTEYSNYYNSLGVFLINKHIPLGQTIHQEPIWGLFIIDSYKTNKFEKNITKFISGYISHRLFDIFSHIYKVKCGGK